MTEQELIKGYEEEIAYQRHMIDNLKRWFTLFALVASLGVLGLYFSSNHHLLLTLLALLVTVVAALGMLLFGYGIYKGQQNVAKVIDDFDDKLKRLKVISS